MRKAIHSIGNKLYSVIHKNRVTIGAQSGFRLWKSIKCDKKSKIVCGSASVRDNCHIEAKNGGTIILGKRVNFNYNCTVVAHKGITFGNNVSIGPNTIFYDHDHNYKSSDWRKSFVCDDIIIGNNVWIGGNVIILKGTIVEDGCVIAAGTILKGEHIFPNTLVYNDRKLVQKKIGEKINENKKNH